MTSNSFSSTNDLPPTELLPWLNAEGSLTAILEEKAGQPLRVKRSFEGYRSLTLGQKKQQAQSIFPLNSLKGQSCRLQHLKNTPIGYVLFKRRRTLPNKRFISHTSDGWQRQTCYDWYGRTLMISETFLPAFLTSDL